MTSAAPKMIVRGVVTRFYWALYRFLERPEDRDTPKMVHNKMAMVAMQGVTFCLGFLSAISHYAMEGVWFELTNIPVIGVLLVLALILVARRCSPWVLSIQVVSTCFGIAYKDIFYAANLEKRVWPFLVVVLDLLLYIRAPRGYSYFVMVFGLSLMVVVAVENSVRYGLYDMMYIGLPSYERRIAKINCELPPCETNAIVSSVTFSFSAAVFLFDFYCTRQFADSAIAEQERLQVAVATSQEISACLASFDLEGAEQALQDREWSLTEPMAASFRTLLYNLETYRPYLPKACLNPDVASNNQTASPRESSAHHTSNGDTPESPHEEVVGVTWGRPVPSPTAQANRALRVNVLSPSRITLLKVCANWPPAADVPAFIQRHERFITEILHHVACCRGVVDTFSADTVTASFNASRRCVTHGCMAVAAARACATMRTSVLSPSNAFLSCSGAVATGLALSGHLGSQDMRRPTIVGALPEDVDRLMQFRDYVNIGWVCNTWTYLDSSTSELQYEMRIVLGAMVSAEAPVHVLGEFGTRNSDGRAVLVYELTLDDTDMLAEEEDPEEGSSTLLNYSTGNGEWMYALTESRKMKWEYHNEAARQYLRGECTAAAALQYIKDKMVGSPPLVVAEVVEHFQVSLKKVATVSFEPTVVPLTDMDNASCEVGLNAMPPPGIPRPEDRGRSSISGDAVIIL